MYILSKFASIQIERSKKWDLWNETQELMKFVVNFGAPDLEKVDSRVREIRFPLQATYFLSL